MRGVSDQLPDPEAKFSLTTEPVQLNSHNWQELLQLGLILRMNPMPLPCSPPPPPPPFGYGDSSKLPVVRNSTDLFQQSHMARVSFGTDVPYNHAVTVTCKASMSFLSRIERVWDCWNSVTEHWCYADGKEALSSRHFTGRMVFVDIGGAFLEQSSQASRFCLVQESVDEHDTPIYRFRKFSNVEEAKEYMFVDAIKGIGTIGSVIKFGAS
jgi:hypothetical protein